MRGLSLSRPWPWAIFDLPAGQAKDIENRSWPPPITAIGTTIALHAAKSWDDDAISFLLALGITDFPSRYDQHPHSVIVGVATIDRVRTGTAGLTPEQRRWFFEKRKDGKENFGWVLTNVRKLRLAVECKGKQGLWIVPPLVEAAVMGVLGKAA